MNEMLRNDELQMGPVNGHLIALGLKELIRRAMVTIRNERFVFEATAKQAYGGTMDDVFTSADTKAQEVYLRGFQESFPFCGVIAEEQGLNIPPRLGCNVVFTVDPLDGTKAYVRRQSHGVGTMVAVLKGNDVIGAYVGDVNTDELYGFRPGSNSVWRISKLDAFERLDYKGGDKLNASYMLLRDPEHAYSDLSKKLLPQFKNYESSGGSIGIWFARLWKREVGALLIPPGWETPWDSNPVIGISNKLGYVFLRPDAQHGDRWSVFHPRAVMSKFERKHDLLVVHREDLPQLGL